MLHRPISLKSDAAVERQRPNHVPNARTRYDTIHYAVYHFGSRPGRYALLAQYDAFRRDFLKSILLLELDLLLRLAARYVPPGTVAEQIGGRLEEIGFGILDPKIFGTGGKPADNRLH